MNDEEKIDKHNYLLNELKKLEEINEEQFSKDRIEQIKI